MRWTALVDNRQRAFWLLHTLGWVSFAIVHYIGSLLFEMREIYLFVIILNAYAGWLLTVPLRFVYRKIWNRSPLVLLSVMLGGSYLLGAIWTVVQNYNFWEIYKHGYRPEQWYYYFRYSLGSFYIVLCWSGLYFGVKYYQMLQQEKQKTLTASSKAHEAQLKMLRYQLNPHFLFNTLNAISTLILVEDNQHANQMVTKLSEFLRYSLDKDPIKKVPLSQELYALNLYLDIEKVRFEERLSVNVKVDDSAQLALVPSLILQPLIENAIKYAIANSESGGEINLQATVFGQDLLLEINDNGPGLQSAPNNKGAGVGLKNTQERLAALYDKNYSFVLSDNSPHGLKINMRIPFEREC